MWHYAKLTDPYKRRQGELEGDDVPRLTAEEKKTLICSTCNKDFKFERNLLDHINSHKGRRRQ